MMMIHFCISGIWKQFSNFDFLLGTRRALSRFCCADPGGVLTGKPFLADKSIFVIEHCTGTKKTTPSTLKEVPRTDAIQEAMKQRVWRAQKKDAAWLCQLHSSPTLWSTIVYKIAMAMTVMKMISVFGPLLDSSPARPQCSVPQYLLGASLRRLNVSHSGA